MEEIWKPVEGYEGRYEVSNLGRIKSFSQKMHGRIVQGSVSGRGYRTVKLTDSFGVEKNFTVHRLVAIAFIDNTDNKPHVNHKDENKLNNCAYNLEWCDNKYNMNYGTRNARISVANTCNSKRCKAIFSVAEDGSSEFFCGITEAGRQTGLTPSNITCVLKGRRKSCGGRQWFYC